MLHSLAHVVMPRRQGVAQEGRSYVGFPFASVSSNHPCFRRHISKTRRYTNVVCCKVKILHAQLFPG